MSFSEEQIRAIVKAELRKIIDAGLMYTEETAPKPVTKQVAAPVKDNSTVCPECGGPKKPNFNQCFQCWEKKRAK